MEQLILISFILSLVLGVLRGIDLVFFTNSATGLCMVGSVWLRYSLLWLDAKQSRMSPPCMVTARLLAMLPALRRLALC